LILTVGFQACKLAIVKYAHIKEKAMRELVEAAKSLSDETRLRILNLLMVRECCVCEVMQALGISQTRASRNLNLLYDAGFLKMHKEGLWSYYSIDRPALAGDMMALLKAVELGLAENEVAISDRKNLSKAKRLGPACCGAVDAVRQLLGKTA
jgi:ArsR family transcriptional regulator, arsenate/arsenite/antimonite-responsive transcriptional repressor